MHQVIDVKGRNFIKYGGLVSMGHEYATMLGGFLSQTCYELKQISDENLSKAVVHVQYSIVQKVDTPAGPKMITLCSYDGTGDASTKSTDKFIWPHLDRMAETRAIARALRVMTDIGMTSYEELATPDEVYGDTKKKTKKQATKPATTKANDKPTLSKQRRDLNKTLTEQMKTTGLTAAQGLAYAKEIGGDKITSTKELSDAQIGKLNIKLAELAQSKAQDTSTDKKSIKEQIQQIKQLQTQLNLSPADLKAMMADHLGLDKGFKQKDITSEQYESFINHLEKESA